MKKNYPGRADVPIKPAVQMPRDIHWLAAGVPSGTIRQRFLPLAKPVVDMVVALPAAPYMTESARLPKFESTICARLIPLQQPKSSRSTHSQLFNISNCSTADQ